MLTTPHARARSAEIRPPVSSTSLARARPRLNGSTSDVAPIPKAASVYPKKASSEHTIRSQQVARSNAPPTQAPRTAAIVGMGEDSKSRKASKLTVT